jgi:hypothetical protein
VLLPTLQVWVFVADNVLRPFLSFRWTLPHLGSAPRTVRRQTTPVADNFLILTTTTTHLSHEFHSADFAISYCRILAPSTLHQFQTKHDAHSRKNAHPFHRSLLNTRQSCLTEADTAVAAAAVTAATPTGTKTATLDTAAAPTTVTTTLPAIMHRTGRTIHPLSTGGHQCVGTLDCPCSFASPSSKTLRAEQFRGCACFTCLCRSAERSRTCCDSVEFPLLSHFLYMNFH